MGDTMTESPTLDESIKWLMASMSATSGIPPKRLAEIAEIPEYEDRLKALSEAARIACMAGPQLMKVLKAIEPWLEARAEALSHADVYIDSFRYAGVLGWKSFQYDPDREEATAEFEMELMDREPPIDITFSVVRPRSDLCWRWTPGDGFKQWKVER